MPKRKKALITTPYPTSEEIRLIFGMSKAEMRRIEQAADEIMAETDRKAASKEARKRALRNARRREQRARLKTSSQPR